MKNFNKILLQITLIGLVTIVFTQCASQQKATGISENGKKGKGTPEYWACRIKPGRILFELDGIDESLARRALELGAAKLPISTKFITRGIKI